MASEARGSAEIDNILGYGLVMPVHIFIRRLLLKAKGPCPAFLSFINFPLSFLLALKKGAVMYLK
jgi:hypothetical protein